uniref:Uncharacterized protein n=1 Tax=Rhizophora mucronata TaxID=61149 RepID=A0A2P2IMR8_RHIMU
MYFKFFVISLEISDFEVRKAWITFKCLFS